MYFRHTSALSTICHTIGLLYNRHSPVVSSISYTPTCDLQYFRHTYTYGLLYFRHTSGLQYF